MSDAIQAMDMSQVTPEIIAKIKAQVNFDLIKNNQYDKFGDGSYISVETVRDILNATFNYQWSWEIIRFYDNTDHVVCHGRLTVPGIGVRDGIGQAKADKKDNSTMYSSAASFAFKSAAKSIGIAPNIFNPDSLNYEVFEPGTVMLDNAVQDQYVTADAQPVNNVVEMKQAAGGEYFPPKTQVQSEKKVPTTDEEKGKELKEAYKIRTREQFLAFARIWNPQVQDFSEINIHELHAYAEANPEEFEDYRAEDY